MRVLIAYDGSECSDDALDDLPNAGLPGTASVLIFGVAETPLGDPQVEIYLMNQRLNELRHAVQRAALRVRSMFPGWHVATDVAPGVAESAIAERAKEFRPDLVVVGSHARSRLGRLVLGSVSQSVLHHTSCSVRIAHRPTQRREEPLRLLLGIDGSHDAEEVVHGVASRYWPKTTEARVVGVVDGSVLLAAATPALVACGPDGALSAELSFDRDDSDVQERLGAALKRAAAELRIAGLRSAPQVLEGKPTETLLGEADQWGADCIFVGARGLGRLERLFTTSVSSAIAARAQCSVEVVRAPIW